MNEADSSSKYVVATLQAAAGRTSPARSGSRSTSPTGVSPSPATRNGGRCRSERTTSCASATSRSPLSRRRPRTSRRATGSSRPRPTRPSSGYAMNGDGVRLPLELRELTSPQRMAIPPAADEQQPDRHADCRNNARSAPSRACRGHSLAVDRHENGLRAAPQLLLI